MRAVNNLVISIALAVMVLPSAAYTSEWAEAQALTRLVKQLEASKALLDQAKSNRNPNKRLQFDYEELSKNIKEMQIGINSFLNKPLEPRTFKEIRNSFSNYQRRDK